MTSMNNIPRFSGYRKIDRGDSRETNSTVHYKGPDDKQADLYEFWGPDLVEFRQLKNVQHKAYETNQKSSSTSTQQALSDATDAMKQFLKRVIG